MTETTQEVLDRLNKMFQDPDLADAISTIVDTPLPCDQTRPGNTQCDVCGLETDESRIYCLYCSYTRMEEMGLL